MVIYLNNIPFSTIKRNGQILIKTDDLWTFFRIPVSLWPDLGVDNLTTPGENRYQVNPFATINELIVAIERVSGDYISEKDREAIVNFLEPSLNNRWDRQPEFTPLYRWWRPL